MRVGGRAKLVWLANQTGFVSLLERFARGPALIVVNHHRVGNRDQCPYDREVFDSSSEELDERLTLLLKRSSIISLEEAQSLVEKFPRTRGSFALLTFDDGYRDCYQTIFPILRSRGLTGAFFLPTRFIASDHIPWWDQIAYMVRHAERSSIMLRYPCAAQFDLSGDREAAIGSILKMYKSSSMLEAALFLAHVEEVCAVELPKKADPSLFINWEEAMEMARGGMAFGSHTHSHELLAKLSPEQQHEELRLSKQILESHLAIKIDALAYPVGTRESFSPATRETLRKLNYRTAFSYYGGANLGAPDRYDVRRINSWHNMGSSYFRTRIALAAVARDELL